MGESKFADEVKRFASKDLSLADWKSEVTRLTRREEIYRQLGTGMSVSEVVETVREYEGKIELPKLLNALVENEFVVVPEMVAIAEDVGKNLRKEFRFFEAFVLAGGSVHGGSSLKKTITGYGPHDIDWGFIYKGGEPEMSERQKVLDKTRKILPDISKKHGFSKGVSSDGFLNGVIFNRPILNSDSARKLIVGMSAESGVDVWQTGLYFEPSFPSSVNEENRRYILESLRDLYKKDKNLGLEVFNKIMRGWRHLHKMETKHLGRTGDSANKNMDLQSKLSEESAGVMEIAMWVLLKSAMAGNIYAKPLVYNPNHG